jgi:hypothetical protein
MIVTLCSDKGSPGVTTLATALGLVWPGVRMVVEADPSGSDLAFRLRPEDREGPSFLPADPSMASLATAARLSGAGSAATVDLGRFSQATSLGLPVIVGMHSRTRFQALRHTWPSVAAVLTSSPGTAVVDLGRFESTMPTAPVAMASTTMLLVSRFDVESLARLREKVGELAAALGPGPDGGVRIGVVVSAPAKNRKAAEEQTATLLDHVGSPVPLLGSVAWDPRAATALWAGTVTRRLAGSDLIRSARDVTEAMIGRWPQLGGPATGSTEESSDPVGVTAEVLA